MDNYEQTQIITSVNWRGLKWDRPIFAQGYLLKKWRAKGSSLWTQRRAEEACQWKTLTLGSRGCCRRKGWSRCRCRWVRTRRANHKSMWQCFGVWGLSPKSEGYIGGPMPVQCAKGGGLVLTLHLVTWYGNEQYTGRNYQTFPHYCGMLNKHCTLLFWLGKTIKPRSIPGDTSLPSPWKRIHIRKPPIQRGTTSKKMRDLRRKGNMFSSLKAT